MKKLWFPLVCTLAFAAALLSRGASAQEEPSCTQRCAEESVACISQCQADGGAATSCTTTTCRQKAAACIEA